MEGYWAEYGCPIAYADEIAEGILDNFGISYKTPPARPQCARNSSRGLHGGVQNHNETRRTLVPSVSALASMKGNSDRAS